MGDELARFPVGWLAGPPEDHGVRVPHYECSMRAIVGGLNHLKGKCICCGGTEPPDPPEMSSREAAKAAVQFWEQNGRPIK